MWFRRHGKGRKGSTRLRPWSDGEAARGQAEAVDLGERRRRSGSRDRGKREANGGTAKHPHGVTCLWPKRSFG
ncbi:hypothetical protein DsansV1_C23g0178761 [Dioscorea sansibarensis]